jgi:thiamine-phosphate diphosphorylase
VSGVAAPLPRLLVLTDRRACRAAGGLVDVVAAVVDGGARAVVVREKDLPTGERLALADEIAAVARPAGALVVVASGPDTGDGVHLAAADPWPAGGPGGRERPAVVGRSCHDAVEVAGAVAAGADYVTVSPVHPTPSKPGYGPALGEGGLAELVAAAGPVPVFALGGITPDTVTGCLGAGAYGVAVMGAVMAADDPRRTTAELRRVIDDLVAERTLRAPTR